MSSSCDEDATAVEVGRDGALSRWALGSLVLVALAASEITGAGTVASLPVAFITVTLSGKVYILLSGKPQVGIPPIAILTLVIQGLINYMN